MPVVALGVVALAAACVPGCGAGPHAGGRAATQPPGSADRVCVRSACVSLSRLADSINTQLQGKVVGYVALIDTSRVFASGPARTAADPPQLAMGPDVMVNVASVGKMFTTIAVLQSLARLHLSIDSRIAPFLPPDWVKGPGVNTITFRELLTHRAGFRLNGSRVFVTDNAAREQIRHGIRQADKQAADYNNINFTIFRDLLPFLEGARDQGPAATRFFISYVQRQVFAPVHVTDAICGPVRDAMLMYPPPGAATGPGRPVPAGPSGCAGGGWFMTPASMLRVLDGLIHGTSLLSASQRQQMDRNCLGWDCSLTGTASYVGKGGDSADGLAALHTFIGVIAGTIPVVIVTNSNWGPTNPRVGENLIAVLRDHERFATSERLKDGARRDRCSDRRRYRHAAALAAAASAAGPPGIDRDISDTDRESTRAYRSRQQQPSRRPPFSSPHRHQ